MIKVSHKQRPVTVRQLIERGARHLQRARVYFGHGTDNAWDESAALVWHALKLPTPSARIYARTATLPQQGAARELIRRRIQERTPAVYLTGTIRFAGLKFKTDGRALIPRSPIAELIERGYAPWIDARRVRRVLDVGTGSGCIAIATAKMLPKARVDALDCSAQALGLAAENVRHHRLGRRVRLLESDYFGALNDERYDIIVSNPPYVGARELRSLPPEYRHEPRVALASGKDGMDAVRVILKDAGRHLNPGGILIVEVGNTQAAVRRAFSRLPFTWLTFVRGGGGVFVLTAEQLGS
ncbi:MAG TPA: 50S ribosomal protein L3 N(5)-glutamine methyltransferase [Steroidobacteraceae bacterium]